MNIRRIQIGFPYQKAINNRSHPGIFSLNLGFIVVEIRKKGLYPTSIK